MRKPLFLLFAFAASTSLIAQSPSQPDWTQVEAETMKHFQAIIRLDSTDPPGNEKPVVDYLKQVLEAEGIPVEIFAMEPNRPNLVARIKGTGSKKPLLIVGHTDTVNVDPKKWSHPPFSADREGGWVYGRGTVDDKDNVAATMMAAPTNVQRSEVLPQTTTSIKAAQTMPRKVMGCRAEMSSRRYDQVMKK
jgi:acetylornithine deacetylase/succinyl-diaminopimelate desuccinylase-like protein